DDLLLLRFPLVLWVLSRIEITRVGGTKTRDMHDHGIVSRLRKMIDAAGLGINAAHGKRLQSRLVKMRSISKVPGSGHDCRHAVITMRMSLNGRVWRDE